ncbi:hypothetical protein PAXRUDRAFT_805895 [Paxillus rubicundulus Ve08.2h10]|uniref:Unplaced genomic scaffold scaffold_873, whole genome shotgun sequence n=1 Tax=Paxillus rubicundulus Ve08.2h10 TaxID=930991 RepID=A0A0D0DCQ5_9AGAM|nr:hypothetical protein PAXRUDRAFT_805895 [Paxillus rubicundulus Ve08.2h10]
MVTCSCDKTIRIWDVEKGEQEGTSVVHKGGVRCLAVTRDGNGIVSGGEDKRITMWDRDEHATANVIHSGPMAVNGHEHLVNCFLWSMGGSKLFSAPDGHGIRCWNSETGEPIGKPWTGHTHYRASFSPERQLQHKDYLSAAAFSPSGEFMACGEINVSIWPIFHGGMTVRQW